MTSVVQPNQAGVDALVLDNLSKTFPGTRALKNVSITFRAGEIHALVGMNGSGKSTVVKILSGYHEPDAGSRVVVGGHELRFGDPDAARSLGVQFVHQDLALLGSLNTVENLAVERGFAVGRFGPISWKAEVRRAQEAMDRLGYSIDVRKRVSELSAAQRSAVAIARAFVRSPEDIRVIILDEPTASMPASEVADLFALLRRVAAQGVSVIFISHHFDEIFELADKVSVLRDGAHIATVPVSEVDHDKLVTYVAGASIDTEVLNAHRPPGPAVIDITGLSGGTLPLLNLIVGEGEIVGVAGLDGSGREHVCQLIFGALERSGRVTVGGRDVPANRPDLAISAGLALVPAERHRDALFATMTVRENITMGAISTFMKRGILSLRSESKEAQSWITRLMVKTPDAETKAAALSGGNQQKLVFARALRRRPSVVLLDEPTQGVDVRAKEDIYAAIQESSDNGSAVIVASSDSGELVRNCSRVMVLSIGGEPVELIGDRVTEDNINRIMLAGSARESAQSGNEVTVDHRK